MLLQLSLGEAVCNATTATTVSSDSSEDMKRNTCLAADVAAVIVPSGLSCSIVDVDTRRGRAVLSCSSMVRYLSC